ncbi:MAG TPA: type II secretion system secretin GspD [Acidiferrobacteraceae bacterium]|nr:type II secretion system secretin GspD [Acidiferrobacteraceae bacterium]
MAKLRTYTTLFNSALVLGGGLWIASAPLVQAAPPAFQKPAGPVPQAAPPPLGPPGAAAPAPSDMPADTGPRVGRGQVLFNFENADIRAVVKTVSDMTGRNFLLDPQVQGKVTIISGSPVSRAAAYQIFLTALKAQGFTAVAGPGGAVRILPQAEGNQSAPVNARRLPYGGDQLVTQVVTLRHSSAAQMMPLLRPLMAPTGVLSMYAPSNTLVVTDYADNVRRLLRIVAQIDHEGNADVAVLPLRYASALDMAQLLVRLSAAGGMPAPAGTPMQVAQAAATPTTIVPDLRTNSLIVRTNSAGRLAQIRHLVQELDVPARRSGQTHVVYLRNASAVNLAKVLRGLMEGQAQAASVRASAPPAGGATPVAAVGAPAGGAVPVSLIQADPSSNALIISAPDALYNNLRAVIAKLDIRRAQVFVQALIAEVTSTRAAEFGIQWGAAGPAGSGTVAGVANFPLTGSGIVSSALNPAGLATAAGLTVGYLGESVTLPNGQTITGLGALARALQQDSDVNVLSTPDLLTMDNASAKIMVGQNVPFVTGSYAQAAGTTAGAAVNPFQTIERKDVGLSLKIKPQISQGNAIKLKIAEDVSSIAPATTGAVDIVTNKRSLSTTVLVDNARTIVLGGLIENSVTNSRQSIPILGRIPILGALFKYRQRQNTKTNLMIFLKPTIVRAPSDAMDFTSSRYAYIRGEEQGMRLSPSIILPRYPTPEMPPLTQPSLPPAAKAGTPHAAPGAAPVPASVAPASPGTP